MANPDISAKSFMNELMNISLHLVWKDPYYANTYESQDNRIDAETYVAARNDELHFNSVFQFHEQVLQAFFPDPDQLFLVMNDKNMIPDEMRDQIMQAEAKFMINYWENENGETNSYYRMLFGLPPIDATEKDFIYNTKYADIDMTTPLHLLPYTERLKLDNRGYFDELLANIDSSDLSKRYLQHLGRYRIYPYISREAEPFQLLYVQQSQFTYLRNDFIDTYEQARRMVLRVYYTNAYRNKSHLYEGFLGMCILFITQQRMCEKYLEADIARNFYDLESLKVVYDAYGVPFYSSIPLKYHERIVKKLNELLSYKGSTQVFYDLFSIFDFGQMEVFEYYLVKKRITDEDGNPIFRDKKGNLLSPEQMWNIHFSKVPWKSDKFVELTNPDNFVEYEDLTVPDPYWVEDDQLKDKLYKTDWNFFQSKYMGVQIMFDLSKLIFESCYFLRLLEDNRDSLSSITTYYMVTGEDIPIFDMVIYTVALLCKNAGFTGEIPSDPASVAAVYGFNFKQYNQLLKMASESMDDFVKNFKVECHSYADNNPVLAMDETLSFCIDQITDGAFNYLGDDFPYDTWGHAPTPIFLHDFTPTNNSVTNLKKYLKDTIKVLKEDPTLTDYELSMLYAILITHDDYEFNVVSKNSIWSDIHYETFVVKSKDFNEEDLATLRKAVISSYEQMLAWVIKLLEARTALTFDPQILELIANMNIDSADDICRVYKNIEALYDLVTVKLRTSTRREDYEAFANLRKILLTTGLMNKVFQKSNGTIASTYADLLQDINPSLYSRYADPDVDTSTEEQYAIQTLMKLCDDLSLLESINTNNIKKIVDHLFKILRFFKSAKVDLVDFQIIYLITDRAMNYIKLLSEIFIQDVVHLPNKKERIYLRDLIWATFIKQYFLDRIYLIDKDLYQKISQTIKDPFQELTDELMSHIDQTVHSDVEFLLGEIGKISISASPKSTLSTATFVDNVIDSQLNIIKDMSYHKTTGLLATLDAEILNTEDEKALGRQDWSLGLFHDALIKVSEELVPETP